MDRDDWVLVGKGPTDATGAVWRVRLSGASLGWLYAMWNVESKTYSMTFVPEPGQG